MNHLPDGMMAARPKPASFNHIVRDPRVCGGEPTIKGTRIPVRSVIIEYQRDNDLDWVLQGYPRLDADLIREALAYYDVHRTEIDQLNAEEEDEASRPILTT